VGMGGRLVKAGGNREVSTSGGLAGSAGELVLDEEGVRPPSKAASRVSGQTVVKKKKRRSRATTTMWWVFCENCQLGGEGTTLRDLQAMGVDSASLPAKWVEAGNATYI